MISYRKLLHSNESPGMILVALLMATVAIIIIGLALVDFSLAHLVRTNNNVYASNATLVAEAGIEQSVQSLNQDDNFAGFDEQVFFNNPQQGRGVFTAVVEDTTDTNAKTITSTAKVYKFGTTTNPISSRTVKVTVVGTGSEGYSVHTGPGGLILGGSANITNSDVFVNGTLSLSGAARIGTYSNPVNVNVAHIACPTGNNPGPSYPQVCGSGEPISLQWSTYIYGTVCATNQVGTGPNPSKNIVGGDGGAGLVSGCIAPPVTTPSYDRASNISNVTTTAAGNSNTYVCNSWPFDRVWPAHLKLTGNVNVGGSCNIIIKGDVYITGNLTIGGAARITVDNSTGTDRPEVLVDGTIDVGGSAQLIANSSGTGIHFISSKSAAACNPNCSTVTGTELKTSQNLQTINIGGAVNLPGMIFQAQWGKLKIGGSGSIGSAIGQTIDMSGAGTVVFGTSLSSGAKTWSITSYQQIQSD